MWRGAERTALSLVQSRFLPSNGQARLPGIAMPTYDYRCEANGQVYEVRHAMALRPRPGASCVWPARWPKMPPLRMMRR